MKKCLSTDKAPPAGGPYSQAVMVHNGAFIFTAGQIPADPVSGEIVGRDIQTQTRQVFENIKAVLKAANASLESVVKTTVFLKDMNDFAAMNEMYATFFPKDQPARSAVQAARLPRDVLIEVETIAHVSG